MTTIAKVKHAAIQLRPARGTLTLAARITALATAITTGTTAAAHALTGDPTTAAWAAITTLWAAVAYLYATHTCPAAPPAPEPEPVQRGLQAVNCVGGPEDGGTYAAPFATGRDLLGAEICIEGTDYTVTSVVHTCYTAELTRALEAER